MTSPLFFLNKIKQLFKRDSLLYKKDPLDEEGDNDPNVMCSWDDE